MIRWLVLGALILIVTPAAAQDARTHAAEAKTAYEAKDYARFVEHLEAALKLRPGHPTYIYNLAAGHALLGNKVVACDALAVAAKMGLAFRKLAEDPDFNSIRETGEFQAAARELALNLEPKVQSSVAFTIPEKGLVPEGIAHDPATDRFFVSSVYQRKIFVIGADGSVQEFSKPSDDLWSVLGLRVDPERRLLWACTAAHPQMRELRSEENGRAAIVKYHLDSGELLARIPVAEKLQKHLLGDLVVAPNGDIYATDSISPAIYRIAAGREIMELFLAGTPFQNLQGLALSPAGDRLYVADYAKGIFVIDVGTKSVKQLANHPNHVLLGIDGLYLQGNTLIAIQNGITPNRIISLGLDSDAAAITYLSVLEANNPLWDEPTLGTIVDGQFYFVANTQWSAVDDNGRLAPADKLQEAVVLKLPL